MGGSGITPGPLRFGVLTCGDAAKIIPCTFRERVYAAAQVGARLRTVASTEVVYEFDQVKWHGVVT